MCTFIKTLSSTALNNIKCKNIICANMCTVNSKYETLQVSVPKPYVYHVELNRPDRLNAMNKTMWLEVGKCFNELHSNPKCRSIVLSANGKLFCAGNDLKDMMNMAGELAEHEDIARKAKILGATITLYQNMLSSLEKCAKPVLAAVHSACVGAGINMITAADMRYCTKDAFFQVKEVDIGMAADVGVLQRLPKIIGSDSLVREICYTARKLPADEARTCGLVSKVYENKEEMLNEVLKVAEEIASKSPVAVQGTKSNLVFSRDHTVQDGLDHIARWNQSMLTSEDFIQAAMAQASKQKDVEFNDL